MTPERWWRPWLFLAGVIAAIDYTAVVNDWPTLSTAFRSASRHPVRRWPTSLAWAFVTLHLYGAIPARLDPLSRAPGWLSLSPTRESASG